MNLLDGPESYRNKEGGKEEEK